MNTIQWFLGTCLIFLSLAGMCQTIEDSPDAIEAKLDSLSRLRAQLLFQNSDALEKSTHELIKMTEKHERWEYIAHLHLQDVQFAWSKNDFKLLDESLRLCETVVNVKNVTDRNTVSSLWFFKALVLKQKNRILEAIEILETHLQAFLPAKNDIDSMTVSNFLNAQSVCHYDLGEHEKAILYLDRSIRFQKTPNNIWSLKSNQAEYFHQSGNLDKADELYHELCHDVPSYVSESELLKTFAKYIELVIDEERLDEAQTLLTKIEPILIKNPRSRADYDYLLARVSMSKGKFKEGMVLLHKSLDGYMDQKNNDLAKHFRSYADLCENALRLKLFEEALEYNDQMIKHSSTMEISLPLKSFHPDNLVRNFRSIETLHFRSKIFEAMGQLDSARQFSKIAIELLEEMATSFQDRKNIALIMDKQYQIFEQAIHLSYQKNDLEGLYNYIERSRNSIMRRLLRRDAAFRESKIPDSERRSEADLQYYLAKTKEQMHQTSDSITKNTLASRVFEHHKGIERIHSGWKKNYPEFYEYNFEQQIPSTREVQLTLKEASELVLNFFVGDSSIYVFSLNSESISAHKIARNEVDDANLHGLIKSLKHPGLFDTTLFDKAAAAYQYLFKENMVIETLKRLTIIPSSQLSLLPFEILLKASPTENTNFINAPFLMRDCTISYASSAADLINTHETLLLDDEQFAIGAFGGYYEDNEKVMAKKDAPPNPLLRGAEAILKHLPGVEAEINGLKEVIGGEYWYRNEYPERNFKEAADKYAILHLSMHGVLNDEHPEYSYLAFSNQEDSLEDNRLHASEIYNLDLNADLAVLSACSTGEGEIQKGEGVMSLSRAFAYANCPSTIMSLWSASDEATKEIMLEFYRQLKQGKAKDVSLRLAKLKYLEDVQEKYGDPYYAHPFFWAAFVPNGDMSPVFAAPTKTHSILFLVVIIGLGCLALFIWRRGRSIRTI